MLKHALLLGEVDYRVVSSTMGALQAVPMKNISQLMRKHRQLLLMVAAFACLDLVPTAAGAANYYVATNGNDSNAGTQSAPWKTIAKAAKVVVAGDTVHVAPGTYSGGIITTKNGTSSARITFVSDTKWGARIYGGSDAAGWTSKGQYTTIDSFDIDGSANTWQEFGLDAQGTGDIIRNNHVHHAVSNIGCPGHGGDGINAEGYYGGTNIDIIGNVVNNNGPSGSCSYIHGIYVIAPGSRIYNNLVYANSGYGIHLWHDDRNEMVVNKRCSTIGMGLSSTAQIELNCTDKQLVRMTIISRIISCTKTSVIIS